MKKNSLKNCPVCGNELIISKLKCTDCDIEYSGEFEPHPFFTLDGSDIEFVKAFLKAEGNISKMQTESGKTYASIKNTLNEINVKLGSTIHRKENISMDFLANTEHNGAIKVIQDKLLACGGRSKLPMLKGEPLDMWVSPNGNGIENSGYTALVCEWHILEAIVKKANELGGTMFRGDSAAQNGAKIGSADLPADTVDGFISLEFYGASIGSSTTRRSTYYAAILAWAGIVENHRSKGQGGYIVVKPEFRTL